MKHLIVVAHPVEDSFTMSLVRAYAAELQSLGHSQRTYDLYRRGFNPILPPQELAPSSADHPLCADIGSAQDDLREADCLTVVYPLWWLSMPAIMKGYIDRVFARGFAYEARDGVVHGLLAGKSCVLVTVSGAPMGILSSSGKWAALEVLQDTHIFRAAGFDMREHLHFDEVTPHLPKDTVEQHLGRIRASAQHHFPRIGAGSGEDQRGRRA